MPSKGFLLFSCLMISAMISQAANSACADCCKKMGGIHYCDSSAGRFVCGNGYYSACYCDRHAVMDLQKISGCCLWQGGVMATDDIGQVICNNGGISQVCSVRFNTAH